MNLNDLNSFSFDEIRKALAKEISSGSITDKRWRDFYIGGAGTNLIELAAGIGSFLAFQAYMNRQDSLLDKTQLGSSAISISSTIGYNANRKAGTRFRLSVFANENFQWRRGTPLGSFKSYNMSLLKDTYFKIGLNVIEVVLGDWNSHNTFINESKDFLSLPIEADVDQDLYDVFIDSSKIPVVHNIEDFSDQSVMMRSFPTGIYLIFGNGMLGLKAPAGNVVSLEYLTPIVIKETTIVLSDFKFNTKLELTEAEVSDQGSTQDSLTKIQAISPGYSGTRRLLNSWDDYRYIISAYKGMISGNAKPVKGSCCTIEVVYLRDDETRLKDEAEQRFLDYLYDHALIGTSFIIKEAVPINVNVKLKVLVTRDADTLAIRQEVEKILNKQCKDLGGTFSPAVISSIKNNDILRVYIDYPIKDKIAEYNQYFRLNNLDIEFITEAYTAMSFGLDKDSGYEGT